MSIDRLPPISDELASELKARYCDSLLLMFQLAELLDGKVTPDDEVRELNRSLDEAIGKLYLIRSKADTIGVDLPDPLGEPKGGIN